MVDNICFWCVGDQVYEEYHNNEWGRRCYNDYELFEKISLEVFQGGLSWITILKKRDNFKMAFTNFDFYQVAEYKDSKVYSLLSDSSIIRHKGKILATINNARCAIELVKEFGSISNFLYSFTILDKKNRPSESESLLRSYNNESVIISNKLKERGWKFIGPKNTYALMQSIGIVNDHIEGCFVGDTIESQGSCDE